MISMGTFYVILDPKEKYTCTRITLRVFEQKSLTIKKLKSLTRKQRFTRFFFKWWKKMNRILHVYKKNSTELKKSSTEKENLIKSEKKILGNEV